jgi:hypothetical protein
VSDFLTWQTFVAFVLGVLLSAMVKGSVSQLKSKI